jgi:hypothetical protein
MAAMNTPFALSTEDKYSSLWRRLMAHWEDKINTLHTLNEGDRSEIETAKLRGRIMELRSALALNRDPILDESDPQMRLG